MSALTLNNLEVTDTTMMVDFETDTTTGTMYSAIRPDVPFSTADDVRQCGPHNTQYWNSEPAEGQAQDGKFVINLSGLNPGTTYYFGAYQTDTSDYEVEFRTSLPTGWVAATVENEGVTTHVAYDKNDKVVGPDTTPKFHHCTFNAGWEEKYPESMGLVTAKLTQNSWTTPLTPADTFTGHGMTIAPVALETPYSGGQWARCFESNVVEEHYIETTFNIDGDSRSYVAFIVRMQPTIDPNDNDRWITVAFNNGTEFVNIRTSSPYRPDPDSWNTLPKTACGVNFSVIDPDVDVMTHVLMPNHWDETLMFVAIKYNRTGGSSLPMRIYRTAEDVTSSNRARQGVTTRGFDICMPYLGSIAPANDAWPLNWTAAAIQGSVKYSFKWDDHTAIPAKTSDFTIMITGKMLARPYYTETDAAGDTNVCAVQSSGNAFIGYDLRQPAGSGVLSVRKWHAAFTGPDVTTTIIPGDFTWVIRQTATECDQFLNGEKYSMDPDGAPLPNPLDTIALGNSLWNASGTGNHAFRKVRIFERALTDDEVLEL